MNGSNLFEREDQDAALGEFDQQFLVVTDYIISPC